MVIPDLHALAGECERLYDELGDLDKKLEAALNAAYGEIDETTQDAIEGTASGDNEEYVRKADEAVWAARTRLAAAQEHLATVQGFREFAKSGAVSA
jgi:hypothetical protein